MRDIELANDRADRAAASEVDFRFLRPTAAPVGRVVSTAGNMNAILDPFSIARRKNKNRS